MIAPNLHTDRDAYGCDPAAYAAPSLPEGWRLVATHSPAEPYGWQGCARVLLVERTTHDDYATILARPDGRLFEGDYDLSPLAAWDNFQRRCSDEDRRASRYIAAMQAASDRQVIR